MPTNTTLAHVRWLILTGTVAIGPSFTASALTVRQEQPSAQRQTPASVAIAEGQRLLQARELDAAREQYAKAIELAREEASARLKAPRIAGWRQCCQRKRSTPRQRRS